MKKLLKYGTFSLYLKKKLLARVILGEITLKLNWCNKRFLIAGNSYKRQSASLSKCSTTIPKGSKSKCFEIELLEDIV